MLTLKKNEKYSVEITGMTHEGQGVGRINNFTVFVEGAITGEKVETLIIKLNKTYAVGKLLNIIESSPSRRKPFCEVYKRCGGCNLQHLHYEEQLKFKTNLVEENIKRIGKIQDVHIHPTIGMDNHLNYRNKAQYPVGSGDSGINVGFYATRSHNIIDHPVCHIQSEVSDKVKSIVKKFILDHKISIYDEKSEKGLLRHIMTRVGFKTGEVMVVLVINGSDLPHKDQLIYRLQSTLENVKSIILNINTQNSNVILGSKNKVIYGSETIIDTIGQFKFHISPLSFFQVNPLQTQVLYQKALDYAGLTGNEIVFDLYCGIGTITLFLSQKAKKVYGVEIVEDAVHDARKNAQLNHIENVEFMTGGAEKVIPEVYAKGIMADVVVVDPPRKGCDEVLLKTLIQMQPHRIVYVSCNPSTLARDLKYLEENDFKTSEIQPVDMFPHTAHVECVVGIHRKNCL
ncbi:MAG: 23S rRNA (uracil(1939)-C(5))-methyltransferase RlmD [Clostridia bacterium]|nr:23S rRNA (uracil(1939)-C(5))-methyltransferase RlmD [Clostridia bacterium]